MSIAIPRYCEGCKESVVDVKSIIFYCDCVVTLCPGCARKQLAKESFSPYVQVVSCPRCQTKVPFNPMTTMDQLNKAVQIEETVLAKSLAFFSHNEYEDNLYSKMISCFRSQPNPLLFDLVPDEKSQDELRTYIIRAEIHRTNFPHRRSVLFDLPLNAVAEVLHPQIQMTSVSMALKVEESYLCSAYEHFGLGNYSTVRFKEKIMTFKKLHSKFKEIGLLYDLHLNEKGVNLDYVRLSLARAEAYRQENLCISGSKSAKVSIRDLPIGPLSAINFKNDHTLERIVNNMGFENKCVVCRQQIEPNESVLFTCHCSCVQCQRCVIRNIGSHYDTFRADSVGIQCVVCRELSHFVVKDAENAVIAEEDLVMQSFKRKYPNKKAPKLVVPTTKTLEELHILLSYEAIELGLYHAYTNMAGLTYKVKEDARRLRTEVGRLEFQYREWERLGQVEFYKLYDDYLPLGPLTRLRLNNDRMLELYLHGKAANSKKVDLTIMDVDDNEDWKKREREKEEEAIRLKLIDQEAEKDRLLQNQDRQQVQKKRREREKKELEEEEKLKEESEQLKLREQAILMLNVEVDEEEDGWVDYDEDKHNAAVSLSQQDMPSLVDLAFIDRTPVVAVDTPSRQEVVPPTARDVEILDLPPKPSKAVAKAVAAKVAAAAAAAVTVEKRVDGSALSKKQIPEAAPVLTEKSKPIKKRLPVVEPETSSKTADRAAMPPPAAKLKPRKDQAKVPPPAVTPVIPPAAAAVIPPDIAPVVVAGRITKRAKEYDDDQDDDFYLNQARSAERQQKKNRQSNTLLSERQRDEKRSQQVSAKDQRKAHDMMSERNPKRKSMDPSKNDPTRGQPTPPLHLSVPDLPSVASYFNDDSIFADLNVPSKKLKSVSFKSRLEEVFVFKSYDAIKEEERRNGLALKMPNVGSTADLSPRSPTAAISSALRGTNISAPPVPVPVPLPAQGPVPTFNPPTPSLPSAPAPAPTPASAPTTISAPIPTPAPTPARPRKEFSDGPPPLNNTPLAVVQPVAVAQNSAVLKQPVALAAAIPVTAVLQIPPSQATPHFATSHTYQTTTPPAHIPIIPFVPPHYSAAPLPPVTGTVMGTGTGSGTGTGAPWIQYPEDAQVFTPSYFNHAQPLPWSRVETAFVPPLPASFRPPPPPPPPMAPGYLGTSSPAISPFQQLSISDNRQHSDLDGRFMPGPSHSQQRDERQANGYTIEQGYSGRPSVSNELPPQPAPAPQVPMPPPEPVIPPPPPVVVPTRRITKPTFYIARFEVPRDLIAANAFELQDKKRTKGKNPVLQVVVSALDAQTFTSAEESSDSFELQMLKPCSNLKNTNGRVCEHYKLQNLKVLEYCSYDGTKLQDTRSMPYYNIRSGSTMYLDLIKEDSEIRAKGVAAKVLAKWKSQGGRRHIEGSYGPPVKAEVSRAAVAPPSSSTNTSSSSSSSSSTSSGSGSGGVDLMSVTSSLSNTTISFAPPPIAAATVSIPVTVPPPYLGNIKSEFLPPPRAPSGLSDPHVGPGPDTGTDTAADTSREESSDQFEERGEREGNYNH